MNVLSSYLGSSRPGPRAVRTTRAKPQLANVPFFVLARTFPTLPTQRSISRRTGIHERSCQYIVNKPPLHSLKAIRVDSGCIETWRVMLSTHNKIVRDDAIAARASPAATQPAGPRSLNCKMRINVDDI